MTTASDWPPATVAANMRQEGRLASVVAPVANGSSAHTALGGLHCLQQVPGHGARLRRQLRRTQAHAFRFASLFGPALFRPLTQFILRE